MARIYSGCPVVRIETLTFHDVEDPKTPFQATILWMRRAEADVVCKVRQGEARQASFATDRKGLFSSVDVAIATAAEARYRNEPYFRNRGKYELVVSAAVRDVPMLLDNRTTRAWSSMDELSPSYLTVPETWMLHPERARAKARPLMEREVMARTPVWLSEASEAANIASMGVLAEHDPESRPSAEAEPEQCAPSPGA